MSVTNDITKDLLSAIADRWGAHAMVFRVNVVARGRVRSVPVGTPDILGVIHGVPVAVEVKGPGDKQSPKQRQWQEKWTAAYGYYRIAEDVTSTMNWLEAMIAMEENEFSK